MTFELASLQLSTRFDRPGAALAVPGTVGRGDDPALVLLDGASRAPHRMARLRRQEALLGVQVEPTGAPLRVTVVLLLDEHATRSWRQARDLPIGEGSGQEHPDEDGWHRVVRLSVQGRPRAVALLDLRPADAGASLQRLVVEVPPDEVGTGGLLTLGFDAPEHLPTWARRRLLPDGLSGVCVARVKVDPVQVPTRPGLSTGRAPDPGRPDRPGPAPLAARSLVPRRPGGFVVNPATGVSGDTGPHPDPVRVALVPRSTVPRPAPEGRRARAREPLARAHDLARSRLSHRSAAVLTEVTRVDTGRTRTVRSPLLPDGTAVLELDPSEGPVLCRPSLGRAGGGEEPASSLGGQDWYAWIP